MQLTSVLATISLLALGASAAPPALDTRQDPHEGDFRTFGVAGCKDDNQGVYTVTQSGLGKCTPFVEPVGSISVTDLNNGLQLYVFADLQCTQLRVALGAGTCYNDEVALPVAYILQATGGPAA